MNIIVGLGNPGAEYVQTRHNVGFMVVDRMAQRHRLSGPKSKFHGMVVDGTIAGAKVLLLSPMTYMNRSGLAVADAIRYYKVDPQTDLLVVLDDMALPCGRLRLRALGSSGGHKGLADASAALGDEHFARLRIGIDGPGDHIRATDYVLSRFTSEQDELVQLSIERACDAIECWIADGIVQAMNWFNADG